MRIVIITLLSVSGYAIVSSRAGAAEDPGSYFHPPITLKNSEGKTLITGKAGASPYAADFNRDGKVDLIVGGHINMNQSSTGSGW